MKRYSAANNNMKAEKQRIYLATGNTHKVHEFQELAKTSGLAIEFVQPPAMPAVVEDTGTFIGNARKKAAALKAVLPHEEWVLADDSGLCVDALGGAPGVESAYYAGPEGNAAANLAKMVKMMRDVPDLKRGAHFVCVLVLLRADADEIVSEGFCQGRLRTVPAGSGGFGYDPIFVPDGFSRTLSELSGEEKSKVSHRGRAWRSLAGSLREKRSVPFQT